MKRVSNWQVGGLTLSMLLGLWGSPVAATTVTVVPAAESVVVGESTNVCVDMSDSGGEVVGLQLNMSWDKCLEPVNPQKLCKANPATGKTVQSAAQSKSELKAIIISFTDTNPIPDGQLLCCELSGQRGADRCNVELSNVIGSTAEGVRIDGIRTQNASIVVAGAKASDEAAAAPAGQQVSDSGCSLVAPSDRNGMAGIILLLGLGLAAARMLQSSLARDREMRRRFREV